MRRLLLILILMLPAAFAAEPTRAERIFALGQKVNAAADAFAQQFTALLTAPRESLTREQQGARLQVQAFIREAQFAAATGVQSQRAQDPADTAEWSRRFQAAAQRFEQQAPRYVAEICRNYPDVPTGEVTASSTEIVSALRQMTREVAESTENRDPLSPALVK